MLLLDRVEEPQHVLLLRRIACERMGTRFLANGSQLCGITCRERDLESIVAEDTRERGAEPHAGAHDEAGGHEPRDLLPVRFFVERFFVERFVVERFVVERFADAFFVDDFRVAFLAPAFFVLLRAARFCFATFAACLESAVRVFFGRCAMVLLRFAAAAAFFTLALAAFLRFVAMATSFSSRIGRRSVR
jgi:hypothetical protein